jgi:hypothetical protein
MRSILFAILLVTASACGGKQPKSSAPPPPLTDTKAQAEPPRAPVQEEEEEPEPPVPQGPLELTLHAPEVTVKLLSPGKGKRAPLKLTPKAGTRQQMELAIDFRGKQKAPPELGGDQEDIAPTLVLLADVETKEVATGGETQFQMTIQDVDARDVPGARPADKFKEALSSLANATIGGAVKPNGSTGDLTLRVETPDRGTLEAMALIKMSLMPMWPLLPTEAVAPGAKWRVTSKHLIADRLVITQTTDYELVGKKGSAWTIKGTAKVSGTEQDIQGAKFDGIGGTGSTEVTLSDGMLVPATKQQLATDFTATAQLPEKTLTLVFHLEQSNAVTPR